MAFLSIYNNLLQLYQLLWRKKPKALGLVKKKILFIINPISGTGRQKKIEKIIDKKLQRDQFEYMIAYTKGPGHATALAEQAAKEGIEIVAIVGGDGSVNEAAKGLIGSNTKLAIIPTGSGNGLARYLNIPLQFKSAIACINHFQSRLIDTVKINEQNFINVAGIGFDAKVSMEFSNFGKRGLLSYLQIVAKQLATYQPKEYELMIDGRIYREKAFLICFANSSQYGNNIHIAPGAKIDDGFLDLLIFRNFPPHATPKLLFDLINQKIDHSKYIDIIKCKQVKMNSETVDFHLDGDPAHLKGEINIEILTQSLDVICQIS